MTRQIAAVTAVLLSLSLAGCGGTFEDVQAPVLRPVAQPCTCSHAFVVNGEPAEVALPAGCYLAVGVDPAALPTCAGATTPELSRASCTCAQEEVVRGELVEFRFPSGCHTAATAGVTPAPLPSCDPARPMNPASPPQQVP